MNINPRIKLNASTTNGESKSLCILLYVIVSALMLALFSSLLSGCAFQKQKHEKRKLKDLDYTLVEDNDIPEKLLETIQKKKEAEFKITFESDGSLYLVHGYGEQETGGYSIAVRDLYITEHALYFDTELLGPENGSNPPKKPSYPYIVVKTNYQKQNVVFE